MPRSSSKMGLGCFARCAGHFTRCYLQEQMKGSGRSSCSLSSEPPVLCTLGLLGPLGSRKRFSHQCWAVCISQGAMDALYPKIHRAFRPGEPVLKDRTGGPCLLLVLCFLSSAVSHFLDHCSILFPVLFLFSPILLLPPSFPSLSKLSISATLSQA